MFPEHNCEISDEVFVCLFAVAVNLLQMVFKYLNLGHKPHPLRHCGPFGGANFPVDGA